MIEISERRTYFGGNEFELFMDFMRLRAAIVKNPGLMKIDQMAMEGIKKAIADNQIDELLGGR